MGYISIKEHESTCLQYYDTFVFLMHIIESGYLSHKYCIIHGKCGMPVMKCNVCVLPLSFFSL